MLRFDEHLKNALAGDPAALRQLTQSLRDMEITRQQSELLDEKIDEILEIQAEPNNIENKEISDNVNVKNKSSVALLLRGLSDRFGFHLGVRSNADTGINDIRGAIELGNAEAMYMLGNILEKGCSGIVIDQKEARNLYQQAAQQNHTMASYAFARMCEVGHGGPEDFKTAQVYYQKSDVIRAPWNLGLMYEEGKGEPGNQPNYPEAARCFRQVILCETAEQRLKENLEYLAKRNLKELSIKSSNLAVQYHAALGLKDESGFAELLQSHPQEVFDLILEDPYLDMRAYENYLVQCAEQLEWRPNIPKNPTKIQREKLTVFYLCKLLHTLERQPDLFPLLNEAKLETDLMEKKSLPSKESTIDFATSALKRVRDELQASKDFQNTFFDWIKLVLAWERDRSERFYVLVNLTELIKKHSKIEMESCENLFYPRYQTILNKIFSGDQDEYWQLAEALNKNQYYPRLLVLLKQRVDQILSDNTDSKTPDGIALTVLTGKYQKSIALFFRGIMRFYDCPSTQKDSKRVAQFFEEAIKLENTDAMIFLSAILENGNEQDQKIATLLFDRAIRGDNPVAMTKRAITLCMASSPDFETSIKLLERAMQLDFSPAIYHRAFMYMYGLGRLYNFRAFHHAAALYRQALPKLSRQQCNSAIAKLKSIIASVTKAEKFSIYDIESLYHAYLALEDDEKFENLCNAYVQQVFKLVLADKLLTSQQQTDYIRKMIHLFRQKNLPVPETPSNISNAVRETLVLFYFKTMIEMEQHEPENVIDQWESYLNWIACEFIQKCHGNPFVIFESEGYICIAKHLSKQQVSNPRQTFFNIIEFFNPYCNTFALKKYYDKFIDTMYQQLIDDLFKGGLHETRVFLLRLRQNEVGPGLLSRVIKKIDSILDLEEKQTAAENKSGSHADEHKIKQGIAWMLRGAMSQEETSFEEQQIAKTCFQKASELNNADAMTFLAKLELESLKNKNDAKVDYDSVFKLLEPAIKQGNTQAMVCRAQSLEKDGNNPVNLKIAAELYETAIAMGDPQAMGFRALMHLEARYKYSGNLREFLNFAIRSGDAIAMLCFARAGIYDKYKYERRGIKLNNVNAMLWAARDPNVSAFLYRKARLKLKGEQRTDIDNELTKLCRDYRSGTIKYHALVALEDEKGFMELACKFPSEIFNLVVQDKLLSQTDQHRYLSLLMPLIKEMDNIPVPKTKISVFSQKILAPLYFHMLIKEIQYESPKVESKPNKLESVFTLFFQKKPAQKNESSALLVSDRWRNCLDWLLDCISVNRDWLEDWTRAQVGVINNKLEKFEAMINVFKLWQEKSKCSNIKAYCSILIGLVQQNTGFLDEARTMYASVSRLIYSQLSTDIVMDMGRIYLGIPKEDDLDKERNAIKKIKSTALPLFLVASSRGYDEAKKLSYRLLREYYGEQKTAQESCQKTSVAKSEAEVKDQSIADFNAIRSMFDFDEKAFLKLCKKFFDENKDLLKEIPELFELKEMAMASEKPVSQSASSLCLTGDAQSLDESEEHVIRPR